MSLNTLLSHWRSDPSVASNITAWENIPARKASRAPFPEGLHPQLATALQKQGIASIYRHQWEAWESVKAGQNTALVTGTASGKTLAYNLPVLDELLKDPQQRALYLFPTKALAHDQLHALESLFPLPVSSYDGDTPANHRPRIRSRAHLVVSNPDMLHLGILPHHTNWETFLSGLSFVVLDEMHVYRGVFGSHVANVIRRLKRIASWYGSHPQFLLTSATIGNPQELGESLIEEPVTLVDKDSSSRGEKHFLIYNPPIIDQDLGLRAGMRSESERLTRDLLSYRLQTILFGRSRKTVEFMINHLRERTEVEPGSLQAYRSGYLPHQRREIESRLRSGYVKVVAATTALELGLDIGGLDAAVLAGYPGTISGTWQQAGRSGRSEKPSLSVLVVSADPLDQFLAQHPEYFFDQTPEQALIDPDNLLILLDHIKCAAFELPFQEGESFGHLGSGLTEKFLDLLARQGTLHHSSETYYWMMDSYPAGEITLRTTSSTEIVLRLEDESGGRRTLGTVDGHSAPWMVHPGAIYLHQGEVYHVQDLDLQKGRASLRTADGEFYTDPEKSTSVETRELLREKKVPGGGAYHGELSVTTQVTGYKRIHWGQYRVLDRNELDLPPQTLETSGYWLALDEDSVRSLQQGGVWASGENDYGPRWDEVRHQILVRDQHTCQVCGKVPPDTSLHVHHLVPIRSFPSHREANRPENLLTVCPRCHQRLESVVRVRTGLSGLAYALHHLAPLLLMCDRHDLGTHVDPRSPLGKGQPTIIIYETMPAGLGFSQRLYQDHARLLDYAQEVITSCPCRDGCPSCVGPGGEQGSGGKKEAAAILTKLTA